MKKKILAIFLSLCMAMSLLPVTALAADAGDTDAKAASALPPAKNGVITLTEDVTLSTAYEVNGGNVIIDLAGHTLAYNGTEDVFLNVKGGSLTIQDSGEKGEVKVNETYNGTNSAQKNQMCQSLCWRYLHAGERHDYEHQYRF